MPQTPTNPQHIIVTGASSGLGREIALQLACQHNVKVTATGRRGERLETLAAEAKASGAVISPYLLDHTDETALADFIASMAQAKPDGVILNAGVTYLGPFANADLPQYDVMLQTNIHANLAIIHGLAAALSAQQGRILIVASLGGLLPVPYQSVYAGTKAFLINYGLSLREEFKSHGVTVNVFAPGGIATEMTAGAKFEKLRKHLAPPARVAKAAVRAFYSEKALGVPSISDALVLFISRLLPRSFMAKQVGKIYRGTLND